MCRIRHVEVNQVRLSFFGQRPQNLLLRVSLAQSQDSARVTFAWLVLSSAGPIVKAKAQS